MMKTKLLKIVRKRFSIIHYDKILDPNSQYYSLYHDIGVYIFYDNKDSWHTHFESYDDAYRYLILIIRRDYYHTKIEKNKPTKIWYK